MYPHLYQVELVSLLVDSQLKLDSIVGGGSLSQQKIYSIYGVLF